MHATALTSLTLVVTLLAVLTLVLSCVVIGYRHRLRREARDRRRDARWQRMAGWGRWE